jgi:mutual gliding-motility protein MglA
MVELNQRDRTIKIKLVYYGPPLGGKTTNLRMLHKGAFWSRRGELVSVNSAQDRTILFDFMPLKTSGFRGFDVKLQLIAVPGQVMYSVSRRVALRGADGVVFVANSALDRFEEDTQSFAEMCQYLTSHQIDPASVPMVLQYNKRDLPEVLPFESLETALNRRRVPGIPAVAARGEGVLETFAAILLATIRDLAARFRTISMDRGQSPEDWVAATVEGIFGKRSLAEAVSAEPHPLVEQDIVPDPYEAVAAETASAHRKLKIALAEDFPRPPLTAAQNSRLQESLAESYAEASAELTVASGELREERDLLRRQLDDVRTVLGVASSITSGLDVPGGLMRGLECLVGAGAATTGSFVLPAPGTAFRALTRKPLAADPVLRSRKGLDILASYRQDEAPSLTRAEDVPELAEALDAVTPALAALVVVPLRTPERLLGFAFLYYTPDAALPSQSLLDHLGLLAQLLRAPLELAIQRGAL